MKQSDHQSVDAYTHELPPDTLQALNQVRSIIKQIVPGAEEKISYKIIGYFLNQNYVIYLGAYKKHLGLYPVPEGDLKLEKLLAPYRSGKSTLKFQLDQALPLKLIAEVVKAAALRRPKSSSKK